ncbi:hypothetical protein SCALIN_C17_0006 [Candidatus Scalindua japonica]|uniref:Uncharacterized protein n=1 Tax=Candidatus Scalindua japonica TaxID=1284222 RepID=A0A286TYJ2_9BACT|nr:hypothetical protein SCALIN_C17_0006 [Candidatus Scalindua japonica]
MVEEAQGKLKIDKLFCRVCLPNGLFLDGLLFHNNVFIQIIMANLKYVLTGKVKFYRITCAGL